MHNLPPLSDLDTETSPSIGLGAVLTASDVEEQRQATVWVSRLTSVVGLICLLAALLLWAARQNHYRPVLALLTIAMFAAILHSYTFEDSD